MILFQILTFFILGCKILFEKVIYTELEVKTIVSTIKLLRQRKNMTQVQLADAVGVKQPTVALWENGQSFPRRALWPKLARVLNCTVDQLLTEKNT